MVRSYLSKEHDVRFYQGATSAACAHLPRKDGCLDVLYITAALASDA